MIRTNDLKTLWKSQDAGVNLAITAFFIASPGLVWIVLEGLGLGTSALFHSGLRWFFFLFYFLTALLEVAAAGYFYRAAERALAEAPAALPAWEEPLDNLRLGVEPLLLAAGLYSPSIFLLLLGLFTACFKSFFWTSFFVTFSFIFSLFSTVVWPIAMFRMIEGRQFRWALNFKEILDDLSVVKLEYAETLLSFLALWIAGQTVLAVAGSIVSLSPVGIYVGGSLTLLASTFFFSSLLAILIRQVGNLYLTLPSSLS